MVNHDDLMREVVRVCEAFIHEAHACERRKTKASLKRLRKLTLEMRNLGKEYRAVSVSEEKDL